MSCDCKGCEDHERLIEFGDECAAIFDRLAEFGPFDTHFTTVEEVIEEYRDKLLEKLAKAEKKALKKHNAAASTIVRRADGSPETCGKCAAIGSNRKGPLGGPGAHAPGCLADTGRSAKTRPLNKRRAP